MNFLRFIDIFSRQSLLAFSLTHCLPDALESVLTSRSLLETQVKIGVINL